MFVRTQPPSPTGATLAPDSPGMPRPSQLVGRADLPGPLGRLRASAILVIEDDRLVVAVRWAVVDTPAWPSVRDDEVRRQATGVAVNIEPRTGTAQPARHYSAGVVSANIGP